MVRPGFSPVAGHEAHAWRQVGLCVWCDCGVRLYEGDLPAERRTTPVCADGQHEWDNSDSMGQCGFFFLCLRCGAKEWTE